MLLDYLMLDVIFEVYVEEDVDCEQFLFVGFFEDVIDCVIVLVDRVEYKWC